MMLTVCVASRPEVVPYSLHARACWRSGRTVPAPIQGLHATGKGETTSTRIAQTICVLDCFIEHSLTILSGPLTVTDANLFLGRLVVSSFPAIFGPNADKPLDADITAKKFEEITATINQHTSQSLTPQEVALGFLNVADETMSRPIRNATGKIAEIAARYV